MVSVSVSAACRVAAQLGFIADDPVVLQETNNTVVWLRPHAIIAKVGKWAHSGERLQRERAVAAALAAAGAPVAPPLADAEPTHDYETGFLVTLWQRLDHNPEGEVTSTGSVNRCGGSMNTSLDMRVSCPAFEPASAWRDRRSPTIE